MKKKLDSCFLSVVYITMSSLNWSESNQISPIKNACLITGQIQQGQHTGLPNFFPKIGVLG